MQVRFSGVFKVPSIYFSEVATMADVLTGRRPGQSRVQEEPLQTDPGNMLVITPNTIDLRLIEKILKAQTHGRCLNVTCGPDAESLQSPGEYYAQTKAAWEKAHPLRHGLQRAYQATGTWLNTQANRLEDWLRGSLRRAQDWWQDHVSLKDDDKPQGIF